MDDGRAIPSTTTPTTGCRGSRSRWDAPRGNSGRRDRCLLRPGALRGHGATLPDDGRPIPATKSRATKPIFGPRGYTTGDSKRGWAGPWARNGHAKTFLDDGPAIPGAAAAATTTTIGPRAKFTARTIPRSAKRTPGNINNNYNNAGCPGFWRGRSGLSREWQQWHQHLRQREPRRPWWWSRHKQEPGEKPRWQGPWKQGQKGRGQQPRPSPQGPVTTTAAPCVRW